MRYIPPPQTPPTETPTQIITKPPIITEEPDLGPAPTPDATVLLNQEGLINITCDKFDYENWEIDGIRSAICVKNPLANHASYTANKGAFAQMSFIGTKVHLLGYKQPGSTVANIYIDGKLVSTPDFNTAERTGEGKAEIVFTSRNLQYGEHTIKIEHNGENEDELIAFAGIYVNPFPSKGGYIQSYDDAVESSGLWMEDRSVVPYIFSTFDEGSHVIFNFYGTRFWLTGVRGSDTGEFHIIIDDGEPIHIVERQDASIAQNNNLYLLYQSQELPYEPHKVEIRSTEYKVQLNYLMFTTYPYESFPEKTPTPFYTPTIVPTDEIIINPTDEKIITPTDEVIITPNIQPIESSDKKTNGPIIEPTSEITKENGNDSDSSTSNKNSTKMALAISIPIVIVAALVVVIVVIVIKKKSKNTNSSDKDDDAFMKALVDDEPDL